MVSQHHAACAKKRQEKVRFERGTTNKTRPGELCKGDDGNAECLQKGQEDSVVEAWEAKDSLL